MKSKFIEKLKKMSYESLVSNRKVLNSQYERCFTISTKLGIQTINKINFIDAELTRRKQKGA